jgi:hypothetical protein
MTFRVISKNIAHEQLKTNDWSQFSSQLTTPPINALEQSWPKIAVESGAPGPVFADLSSEAGLAQNSTGSQNSEFNSVESQNSKHETDSNHAQHSDAVKKITMSCVEVKPTQEEIKRLRGASILALGGGELLQVYMDGKPLNVSPGFYGSRNIIHTLIKLPSAITPTSSITVRACGTAPTGFTAVAMSLWGQPQLLAICENFAARDPFDVNLAFDFEKIGCIARYFDTSASQIKDAKHHQKR